MKIVRTRSVCSAQLSGEIRFGLETETAGQAIHRGRFIGNGVRLLFGFDLQTMFDFAQEPVCLLEVHRFVARQQLQFRQGRQGLERARLLEKGVTRAVQKLQGLHDKFDLANSAGAELHIPIKIFVTNNVALDAAFDRGNFVKQLRRRILRVNERLMFAQKIVGQFFATRDSPRLDQSEALPRFAKTGVVIF